MPKQPKFIHPVRAVRQAVSKAQGKHLSQPAFANLVGTSAATIQSIELGRLTPSVELANRICAATGAEPQSLLKRDGKARDIFGRSYSPESWGITKCKIWPPSAVEDIRTRAVSYLNALMLAADSPGKQRLYPVLFSFDQWLQNTRKEFGLEEASARVLRESASLEWTTAAFAICTAELGSVLLTGSKQGDECAEAGRQSPAGKIDGTFPE